MAKATHTNRGTCQVCGQIQAIDNGSGITAKHGYLVAGYGFFNGVCPGARFVPAEKSLDVTHKIITQLEEAAASHDAEAEGYRNGSLKVTHYPVWDANLEVTKRSRGSFYKTHGGYRQVEITAETPAHIVKKTTDVAIGQAEQNASHARGHINMMRTCIVPRLGQDLYPAADVIATEKKAAKAKAVEGIRFPTKASRKDALDKLNRQFDKARTELQNLYLALPDAERTKAKTDVYYGPMQLNHWRAKHAEAALREFPQAAEIVARINALVIEREEVKAAQ